ncbi:hypothetical protein DXT68_00920 [Microbacterium foliorum]|uniref:Chaperone protein HtpG n=1 Tax=Microbacterium foliorum TaxID=104336 RepID=A0A0F0L6Q0_9MICO|nr:ATP-binding protein [Microbacterium foliorum]AXL10862.1 hypothetical protein DXT68_00920 [Microbacterium foliorum]KJL27201.1 Chaperone protein HtpG [Microbacterium foliorum]
MSNLVLGASRIEALASEASKRAALGGFNLAAARKTLTTLLANIGRTAEFSTYTQHDISHIDALLESIDWIIPTETWAELTVADALVITLAVYVHDLGMLVTKDEYRRRSESTFPIFRDGILGDESSRGVDFRHRLNALDETDQEHFIYEEFVRVHHAERIESWITGKNHERFGIATEAVALVNDVFSTLDGVVKNDIALVARSHHLDDLDDIKKYKISRAYGNERSDEANLQYAAIILRTADLVHVTRDRTPTVQFRLASPTDPLGQREWRKQAAVRAVRPRYADTAGPARIEIHASFDEPDGYFSLMEYLDYCDEQLKLSGRWVSAAHAHDPRSSHYMFPWQLIEREQIETIGFNRNQFKFTFDQQKVLDLLTGHTLYNDASVAIRELVQNSIDAVRLQRSVDGTSDQSVPDVMIEYEPDTRILRVRDRGTGMTEQVLKEHFLKVGSSSYQSEAFKELHPQFASISRFGIGVLSAFMIADEVKVATLSGDEVAGRELVLKSVHGRYLMRDLDDRSDVAKRIGDRGTEIELSLRPSSLFDGSIIDLLRRWIILPRCAVECSVAGEVPVAIGWDSPKQALEGLLELTVGTSQDWRVTEKTVGGAVAAVAETWSNVYKEWELLRIGDADMRLSRTASTSGDGTEASIPLAGVCVQGIRVTSDLPGWSNSPAILVDVSGLSAPTTNVARTDLEAGQGLDTLIESIYSVVLLSIEDQIPEITRRASMRLALKEAQFLFAYSVASDRGSALTKPLIMNRVLAKFAVHPVEVDSVLERRTSSALGETGFSVLIGPAADDAARFMDWLPRPKGMMAILQEGGLLTETDAAQLPLLGGRESLFAYKELLWNEFEVRSVKSLEHGRSLLVSFGTAKDRWIRENYDHAFVSAANALLHVVDRSRLGRRESFENVYCVDETVTFEEIPDDAEALFIGRYRMFGPTSRFSKARLKLQEELPLPRAKGEAALYMIAQGVQPSRSDFSSLDDQDYFERLISWLSDEDQRSIECRDELVELAADAQSVSVWSTNTAWQRRGDES